MLKMIVYAQSSAQKMSAYLCRCQRRRCNSTVQRMWSCWLYAWSIQPAMDKVNKIHPKRRSHACVHLCYTWSSQRSSNVLPISSRRITTIQQLLMREREREREREICFSMNRMLWKVSFFIYTVQACKGGKSFYVYLLLASLTFSIWLAYFLACRRSLKPSNRP